MKNLDLWAHTENSNGVTYVVLPMPSMEVINCDLVRAWKTSEDQLKIEFIETKVRRSGRGTILLHAAAAFGVENSLREFTGRYTPAPGMNEYVREWYRKHGIKIENDMLVGEVEQVLAICGQIMSDYGLLYKIVTNPIYQLKR